MEQDDSSCDSISPIWSSKDSIIVTIEADASGQVQVPVEEPTDELTEFLELHKDKLAELIQANQHLWEERLSTVVGRVLSLPGYLDRRTIEKPYPSPLPPRSHPPSLPWLNFVCTIIV